MPRIDLSERFLSSYAALPVEIQDKVKKQIAFLSEDPRHPSLQTKPIKGIKGIFEARVDQNYRLTYQRLEGDVLLLRVVVRHDETLKKP
jgi:addiction module RelE/StbE family toxin